MIVRFLGQTRKLIVGSGFAFAEKISMQESKVLSQDSKSFSQESKVLSQDSKSFSQESKVFSQEFWAHVSLKAKKVGALQRPLLPALTSLTASPDRPR